MDEATLKFIQDYHDKNTVISQKINQLLEIVRNCMGRGTTVNDNLLNEIETIVKQIKNNEQVIQDVKRDPTILENGKLKTQLNAINQDLLVNIEAIEKQFEVEKNKLLEEKQKLEAELNKMNEQILMVQEEKMKMIEEGGSGLGRAVAELDRLKADLLTTQADLEQQKKILDEEIQQLRASTEKGKEDISYAKSEVEKMKIELNQILLQLTLLNDNLTGKDLLPILSQLTFLIRSVEEGKAIIGQYDQVKKEVEVLTEKMNATQQIQSQLLQEFEILKQQKGATEGDIEEITFQIAQIREQYKLAENQLDLYKKLQKELVAKGEELKKKEEESADIQKVQNELAEVEEQVMTLVSMFPEGIKEQLLSLIAEKQNLLPVLAEVREQCLYDKNRINELEQEKQQILQDASNKVQLLNEEMERQLKIQEENFQLLNKKTIEEMNNKMDQLEALRQKTIEDAKVEIARIEQEKKELAMQFQNQIADMDKINQQIALELEKERQVTLSQLAMINDYKTRIQNICDRKRSELLQIKEEIIQLKEIIAEEPEWISVFNTFLVLIDQKLSLPDDQCDVIIDEKDIFDYQKKKFEFLISKYSGPKAQRSKFINEIKKLFVYEVEFDKCVARYNELKSLVGTLSQIENICEKMKISKNFNEKYLKRLEYLNYSELSLDEIIIRSKEVLEEITKIPQPNNLHKVTDQKIEDAKNLEDLLEVAKNYPTNQICTDVFKVSVKPEIVKKVLDELINLSEDVMGAVRVYVRVNRINYKENSETSIDMTSSSIKNKLVSLKTSQTCFNKVRDYFTSKAELENFGPFYGVFYSDKNIGSNEEIFCGTNDLLRKSKINYYSSENLTCPDEAEQTHSPGIKNLINQIQSGYHICMFGYGYSGSGKTYTLFGDMINSGLTQISLKYLAKKATSIRIKTIYELYGVYNHYTQTEKFISDQTIYVYYNEKDFFNINVQSKIDQSNNRMKPKIEYLSVDVLTNDLIENPSILNKVIKQVTDIRKEHNRIKPTLNNPESSRGHLFITIEIEINKVKGYLTVIDMAGAENPIEMYNLFFVQEVKNPQDKKTPIIEKFGYTKLFDGFVFNNLQLMPSDKQQISKYNTWITNQYAKAYGKNYGELFTSKVADYHYEIETIQQGLYINESIQALKNYFRVKNGQQVKPTVYTQLSAVTNDYKGGEYRNDLLKGDISYFTNRPAMLDILEAFENKERPTKFVMLALVNPEIEPKFCESTFKTLQFANSVKST